jgi:hypothetical protein
MAEIKLQNRCFGDGSMFGRVVEDPSITQLPQSVRSERRALLRLLHIHGKTHLAALPIWPCGNGNRRIAVVAS